MKIRKATLKDFNELYKFGLKTKELKVSPKEEFMRPEEFKYSIKNKKGIFLLAEDNKKIVGFIYGDSEDGDRVLKSVACLVYIAVDKKYRGKGVGSILYNDCVKEFKKRKVKHIYAWANPKSGIVDFFKKKGFVKGNYEIWMDKDI